MHSEQIAHTVIKIMSENGWGLLSKDISEITLDLIFEKKIKRKTFTFRFHFRKLLEGWILWDLKPSFPPIGELDYPNMTETVEVHKENIKVLSIGGSRFLLITREEDILRILSSYSFKIEKDSKINLFPEL